MGLEEVKEEILSSARKESGKIIEEAKKTAQEIIRKARENISDYRKKLEDDKEKLIANLEKMKIAQAQSEAKRIILDKKKEIIEEAFKKAEQSILRLSDTKRKEILRKLVEKGKNEIEIATVYCNKRDINHLKEFNCKEAEIISGAILENADKSVRVDYSLEVLLAGVKDISLQEIAKLLF